MAKILIIEDEDLIGTMIKINLEKAGYTTEWCRDAESMFAALERDGCDLVLLDIMLPGMSGQEALKEMRKQNFNLPVIMVTAKNNVEVKVDALDQGADDYISKPFNMKELVARVGALIRRSRVEPPITAGQAANGGG